MLINNPVPKCIKYAECDTQPPRNLHEEELYEDMKELPPSRPVTEDTEVSYQVVKLQVMRAYGYVMEFLKILEPQPYAEVLELDQKLMEARGNIPPHLQLRKIEEMAGDPPSRVMERFIPQLFYHKAICLLHRKYWSTPPLATCSQNSWSYSRKSCVNSSLALLEHQSTMHRAAQPGGILEKFKWYHFSITNHDFLLAAMILCLDIMNPIQRGVRPDIAMWFATDSEKLLAIERSRAIWAEIVDDCRDARRAVNILTSVLKRLSAKREEENKLTSSEFDTPKNLSASATNPNVDSLRYSPYFTDQFGLGIPLLADPPAISDVNMRLDFLDTLGSNLSVPGDFNWVSSHFRALIRYLTSLQRMAGIKHWLEFPNFQVKITWPNFRYQKTPWILQISRSGHSLIIYIANLLSHKSQHYPSNPNSVKMGPNAPLHASTPFCEKPRAISFWPPFSNAAIVLPMYSLRGIGGWAFSGPPCNSIVFSLNLSSSPVSTYGGASSITLTFVPASCVLRTTLKVCRPALVVL